MQWFTMAETFEKKKSEAARAGPPVTIGPTSRPWPIVFRQLTLGLMLCVAFGRPSARGDLQWMNHINLFSLSCTAKRSTSIRSRIQIQIISRGQRSRRTPSFIWPSIVNLKKIKNLILYDGHCEQHSIPQITFIYNLSFPWNQLNENKSNQLMMSRVRVFFFSLRRRRRCHHSRETSSII